MSLPVGFFRRFVVLMGVVLTLVSAAANALEPDRPIGHYAYVWYENQLPQGTVLSIAQQADGAIWLATYGGLVRHAGDGFHTFDPRVAPAMKSSGVTAVADDGAGGLWVGALNGGLYRYRQRAVEQVPLPAGIDSVLGIVTAQDGAVWLTTNAGVVRMVDGDAVLLGDADGFPPRGFYRGIVADSHGGGWIAADGVGVVYWRKGKVEIYDQRRGLPSNAIYSLAIDSRGTLWAGTQSGPAYFKDGRFRRDPRLAILDGKRIYTLYGDRAGAMWFAPLYMGLCRLAAGNFSCEDKLEGLRGETVRSMHEDHEGNLWLGTTSSGIHRLSPSKLVTILSDGASNAVRAVHQAPGGVLWVGTDGGGLATYRAPDLVPASDYNAQLPSQLIRAIASDADGRLWVGGTEGVVRFDTTGKARVFGLGDGLPGTIVFAFAPAKTGGMWAATLQGVVRIHGEQVETLEGTRGDDSRALYADEDGRLWIGMRSGLRCLYQGVLDTCGTDGLAGTSVFAFHPDASGAVWLGTSLGIMRVQDGEVTRYGANAGFHGDAIFSLFDDGAGSFWFSSNRGIGQVARADLLALDQGRTTEVVPRWYGTADGMLNAQANGASQSPAARTSDGRLWFGTAKGVVLADPSRMRGNPLPPPVSIEQLRVDGASVDLVQPVRVGPGVDRLEFQFAAMSFIAPAAVRYKYKLDGFDRHWQEAGGSRQAHYTNLPPGNYTFRVMASNNDGVWNEQAAAFEFSILPLWHQTWWARGLLGLILMGLLGGAVRLRLRASRLREQLLTLEVSRRTDALSEANAQLERIAAQDALTGIANRREFNRRLLMAWDEYKTSGRELSVLLVDVDDFKAYNDAHGHLAGDLALSRVAQILAQQAGGGENLAARYGGEEFALLLPDGGLGAARKLADAAVAAVQQSALPHRASRVANVVTVSIGMASVHMRDMTSPEDLLHAADNALYRAKASGRNRAVEA